MFPGRLNSMYDNALLANFIDVYMPENTMIHVLAHTYVAVGPVGCFTAAFRITITTWQVLCT